MQASSVRFQFRPTRTYVCNLPFGVYVRAGGKNVPRTDLCESAAASTEKNIKRNESAKAAQVSGAVPHHFGTLSTPRTCAGGTLYIREVRKRGYDNRVVHAIAVSLCIGHEIPYAYQHSSTAACSLQRWFPRPHSFTLYRPVLRQLRSTVHGSIQPASVCSNIVLFRSAFSAKNNSV